MRASSIFVTGLLVISSVVHAKLVTEFTENTERAQRPNEIASKCSDQIMNELSAKGLLGKPEFAPLYKKMWTERCLPGVAMEKNSPYQYAEQSLCAKEITDYLAATGALRDGSFNAQFVELWKERCLPDVVNPPKIGSRTDGFSGEAQSAAISSDGAR